MAEEKAKLKEKEEKVKKKEGEKEQAGGKGGGDLINKTSNKISEHEQFALDKSKDKNNKSELGGKASQDERSSKKESKKEVKKKTKESKKEDSKVVLEREYVIPLRRKMLKVPRYKRAKKAIKIVREFLARHMKVEGRDLNKIKIDRYLNNEIWFRGIKNVVGKIKVKAVKDSDGIVRVELAEIPEKIKFELAREKKREEKVGKVEKKKPEKEEEVSEEEKEDVEEKEKSSVEAGLKIQKQAAIKARHTTKGAVKTPKRQIRKALKK